MGGCQQRVDVDGLNLGLFGDELAKLHQQLLEGIEIDGLATPHPLEGLVDQGIFHQAAGQGAVEGGQGDRTVLKHLHQLAAGAKHQHRAKLWVLATAQN